MELLLFALDESVTAVAGAGGIDALVVDLERSGKTARQRGFDTGVSAHTLDDVARVRATTDLPLVVRVDGSGPELARRLADVAAAGADEALVPMVVDADEAAACLRAAPDGLPVGILVERLSAVEDVDRIGRLPLSRVYVGLMDLMIERGAASPFTAFCDGTIDRVRAAIRQPFGVAGLTRPGRGRPVPVELLAGEMARLEVDFTFLRRSFLADVDGSGQVATTVVAMRRMLDAARTRSAARVQADRRALRRAVQATTVSS